MPVGLGQPLVFSFFSEAKPLAVISGGTEVVGEVDYLGERSHATGLAETIALCRKDSTRS